MDNGETLQDLSPAQSGLSGMTTASFAADGQQATFGFSDGRVRVGQIGFDTTFAESDDKDLPKSVRDLPIGAAAEWDHGMVTRTPTGQFRRQRLKVELEEPLTTGGKGTIRLVDRVTPSSGAVFAWATADGKLQIAAAPLPNGVNLTSETNTKLDAKDLPLPATISGPPKFLVLAGLGDYLYVAWENGRLLRYEIRDPEKPRLVEEVSLLSQPGSTLNSLALLVGGYTLVAGDSQGDVRTWFPITPIDGRDSAGSDGRKMVNAQTFSGNAAVSAITSSSRRGKLSWGIATGRFGCCLSLVKRLCSMNEQGRKSLLTLSPCHRREIGSWRRRPAA